MDGSEKLILYSFTCAAHKINNKDNNKITELRTIFQRESQNS